ncbi:uncharacterized protein MONBRDRAFT_13269 [Monosiga brevicollis MX1]|uniref:Protein kinase domain-containing protein n=1 Tax=Monosiga brevicollis TaxID=81824 RepID=A9UQL3_MONBE|nr:uncharacterized protein MONBRDRAFT_13269 [Monosiga brevicollis MX1]EDQ92619.1 predicted protein [Monosiga brevicollis MX1]|eukprot:XP_001742381.1 hypothetical protein [Monosiga brevicollis MX1]
MAAASPGQSPAAGSSKPASRGRSGTTSRKQRSLFRRRRLGAHTFQSADEFDTIAVLGTGSFGKVFEVAHKQTQERFALKVLDWAEMQRLDMIDQLEAEKHIMRKLGQHPHIVGLLATWTSATDLYMLLQLVPGTDLFEIVRAHKVVPPPRAARYIAQIARGLDYVHHKHIIYRDLKLENLLLNEATDSVLLTDFGLAKDVHSRNGKTKTICGTIQYMSTEVLAGMPYNYRVDWWCLGVVLFVLMVGKYPYGQVRF